MWDWRDPTEIPPDILPGMDQNMSNICLIYLYLADLDADPAVVERNIKSKTK